MLTSEGKQGWIQKEKALRKRFSVKSDEEDRWWHKAI